jgi:cob(I)alamin adenosyltransferase
MGDGGDTSLFGGARVAKDDLRVEAYGTVDELSSVLGLLRTEPLPEGVGERIAELQSSLFAVGGTLADPDGRYPYDPSSWDSALLEAWIDEMDAELPELRAFVLPGGSRAASLAQVARAVCRRAERRARSVITTGGSLPDGILPFLNRLSDTLFVLARFLNARLGVADSEWHPRRAPRSGSGSGSEG